MCIRDSYRKVLKIWKDYVNAFKAGLDKIWFNQAVKFDFTADLTGTGNRQVLCIKIRHYQTESSIVSCIGLGWVSQLMGWVGLVTQNGPMDNSAWRVHSVTPADENRLCPHWQCCWPIQAPECLPGVTRSETVPSMQRLYAVMLRIRRLNNDVRLNVLTFTILGLLFRR